MMMPSFVPPLPPKPRSFDVDRYYAKFRGELRVNTIIPDKYALAVIGRAGATIKEIREKHRVLVKIEGMKGADGSKIENSRERTMLVKGNFKNIIEALDEMMGKIHNDCFKEAKGKNQKPPKVFVAGQKPTHPDEMQMIMLYSEYDTPVLCGKDNSMEPVEKIEADTHSRIRVIKKYVGGERCLPLSNQRAITVTGMPPNVLGAMTRIIAMIEEAEKSRRKTIQEFDISRTQSLLFTQEFKDLQDEIAAEQGIETGGDGLNLIYDPDFVNGWEEKFPPASTL